MPDLSFIGAFASNPLTLSMILIAGVTIFLIWKGQPILKDLFDRVGLSNNKLDELIESDKVQTADIAEIKDNMRHNYLDLLRLTIYDSDLDIEDRLVAAKRYLVRGGNGKTLPLIKKLAADNPAVWNTIYTMASAEHRVLLEQV
jgi:hypothetical protein